ncbi:MAG TPA: alpha/beta hydrolase [Blastocatellia bacterium]
MVTNQFSSHKASINGLVLNYVEWLPEPAKSKPADPILLLHGANGNAHTWNQVGPRFGGFARTLALDLRGHGASEWPRPPAYRCEDYASDIEQLVDGLGLRQVVLLAHSMSVFHSIRFAVSRPEKVSRLILVDIEAAARPEHIHMLRSAGSKGDIVISSVDEAMARERRFFKFADEGALRTFVTTNLREMPPDAGQPGTLTYAYDRATLSEFEAYDEWGRLGRIKCPVLLVYGTESYVVRSEVMNEMARAIQDARVVALERAGHFPQLDNPDGFLAATLDFALGR